MKWMVLVKYLCGLVVLGGVFSCSNTPTLWHPSDKITIVATDSINPDGKQIPSPVQLKIYELSARSTLDNLDFNRAFHQADTLLSDELISQEAHVLQPSASIESIIKLNKSTRFIAILASFIDIDNARWKHIYTIKPNRYYRHKISINDKSIAAGEIKEVEPTENTLDPEAVASTVEEGAETIHNVKDAQESMKGLF